MDELKTDEPLPDEDMFDTKLPIPDDLVIEVRKWLGDDGLTFFSDCKRDHGTVSPVLTPDREGGFQAIPHPVHFREGMNVRNFMRSSDYCAGWNDHEFDNNWTALIERAIDGRE